MPGNFIVIQWIEVNFDKGIGFAQGVVQTLFGLQFLKGKHNMLGRAQFVGSQIHAVDIAGLIFKIP